MGKDNMEREETDLLGLRVRDDAVLELEEPLRPLALLNLELHEAAAGYARLRAKLWRKTPGEISLALESRAPSIKATTHVAREQRPESCPFENENVGTFVPRLDHVSDELVLSNWPFCE